jgi:hypothetical protein
MHVFAFVVSTIMSESLHTVNATVQIEVKPELSINIYVCMKIHMKG